MHREIRSGISGFVVTSWAGWFAPRGTPAPILKKIADDVSFVLNDADVRSYYRELTSEPIGNGPDEFSAILRHEVEYWTSVVDESNLRNK